MLCEEIKSKLVDIGRKSDKIIMIKLVFEEKEY